MHIIMLLRISLRSLQKNKFRSFLTVLGIIIGISAIISTLAIGKGAEEKARQKILAMGNNYIEIYSGTWLHEGKTNKKRRKFQWLTYKDVEVLKKLCPTVRLISPVSAQKNMIEHKTNRVFANIKGGNESFLKILDRKINRGLFYTNSQAERGARVAILGDKSAKELFKTLDPIGKTITVKNTPFTIIGVMKKMENYRGIRDPNLDIIVPIKALKKYILRQHNQSVSSIIISAPTKDHIPKLVPHIKRVIRFRRKIREDEADNFTVVDQTSIMKVAGSAAKTIRLLLLIIASISLLVGGIGIMNIMLVSVAERRKEIGIRMALGANSWTILKQFLAEAITLCFAGGVIGTAVGVIIPHLIAHFTKWDPIVTLPSILVAFATTSLISIFFGYYPARKASKLNPVDALADR